MPVIGPQWGEYGHEAWMYFDHFDWPPPKVGDEWRVHSPAGRNVMGYVLTGVRKVKSKIEPTRHRVRMKHVPMEQLENPVNVYRYRSKR